MADYNAGSIEASLQLDRTQFTAELDRAREEAENFARQRYEATVGVDTASARAEIASLQSQLAALRGSSVNVGVNESGTSSVVAGMQNIVRNTDQARDALGRFSRTSEETSRSSSSLGGALSQLNNHMQGVSASSHLMLTAVLALAPAIVPLTVAAGGLAATLTSMAAAGGGALAVWAGATKGAIKAAQDHGKAVEETGKALKDAQDALAKTTAGTDQYNAALKKVQEAEKAHKDALSALTAEEKVFNMSLDNTKSAWTSFIQATERYTLGPVSTVLQGITLALPKLIPLVQRLSPAFTDVANAMNRWLSGQGFERFVGFLTSVGVPVVNNMLVALRNFAGAGGELMRSFGPLAIQMTTWFAKIGAALKAWAEDGGFVRFKDRALSAWAQLKPVLESLWSALKNIWTVLSLGSGNSLTLIKVLADIISIMPPSVVNALAQAWIYYKLAVLGFQGAALVVRTATAAWAAAQWLLNTAMFASPLTWIIIGIMAVVAVIVFIATKTTWFQTIWQAVMTAVKAAIEAVATAAIWLWQNVILPAWNGIRDGVFAAWNFIYNNVIQPIGNFFTVTIPQWAGYVANFFIDRWNAIRDNVLGAWNFLMANVIQPIGNFFTVTIPSWAQFLFNFVRDRWTDIQNAINAVFQFVMNNIFNPIGTFFTQTIPNWAQALFGFVRDRWNDIQNVITAVFNFVRDNIFNPLGNFFTQTIPNWAQALFNFVRDRWNDIQNAIKGVWDWIVNNIFNPIKTFFTETIPDWANTLKDKVIGAFDAAKNGVKTVWDGLKAVVAEPVKFIVNTVYNNGLRKMWNNVVAKIPGIPELPEGKVEGFARGGPVNGGKKGVDSVPAMLMPGEHVLTTSDVNKLGGQAAVYRFRQAVQSGNVQGYADGGPVLGGMAANGGLQGQATGGGSSTPTTSSPGTLNPSSGGVQVQGGGGNTVTPARGIDDALAGGLKFLKDLAATVIYAPAKAAMDFVVNLIPDEIPIPGISGPTKALGGIPKNAAKLIEEKALSFFKQKEDANKAAAGGYKAWADWQPGDEQRLNYGGVTVNKRTAAMLDHVKSVFGAIQMLQGSYSNSVGASAGTHAGGGAVDVGPAVDGLVGVMRASGFAAWRRTEQEGFSPHIHGIAVGDHELSPEAQAQVTAFFAGKNGLADNGPDTYKPANAGGPGGVIPTGEHLNIINQALAAAGIPPPGNLADWQAGLNTLIQRESGWDPTAINSTDSNAAAGTPSIGLAQVIQPTFDAFKAPGLGNIYNGVANVAAAARYIVATYGNITNVQQANANMPPAPYGMGGAVPGYFAGTENARRGWALVGEKGPEWVNFRGRETVLRNGQTPPVGDSLPDRIIVQIGEHEFEAVVMKTAHKAVNKVVSDATQSKW